MRDHEVSVCAVMRPPAPTAKLVELREPEFVRSVDDHGVSVRHVDAGFYDRRAQEHIAPAVIEIEHDLLQRALPHLTVGYRAARFWCDLAHLIRHFFDVPDFVVHEVHLAAASDLAQNRLAHQWLRPLPDKGLDC